MTFVDTVITRDGQELARITDFPTAIYLAGGTVTVRANTLVDNETAVVVFSASSVPA